MKFLKRVPGLVPTLNFVRGEVLNPGLPLDYRIMRLVCRSNVLRAAALRWARFGTARAPIQATEQSLFPGLTVDVVAEELARDGMVRGLQLPPAPLNALLTFSARTPFLHTHGASGTIQIRPEDESNPSPDAFQYWIDNPHQSSNEVRDLTRDALLVGVARRYLGAEPVLLGSQIWWSYPSPEAIDRPVQYGFHYDIDDYKFLKVFFYLRPVDRDTGPHVVIKGTHLHKNLFEIFNRRLSEEEAARRYGSQITTVTGDAGEGFFEDTFCYHKGETPRKRRLALEIQYGLHDYGPF